MENKKIILRLVVAIALIVTVIGSVKLMINHLRQKTSNPDTKTTITVVEEKRVKEIIPPEYQGPLIELNFRDQEGNRVSARKVLMLPVSDQSAGGSSWALDSSTNDNKGANCLRTALIDGAISSRGLRANTDYYAQREEQGVKLYTPQEASAFSFHTPKYDASKSLYEIDVTLHESNKAANVRPVKEKN